MCRYYLNNKVDPEVCSSDLLFSSLDPEEIFRFHNSLPEYHQTPLISLPNLAQNMRVGQLWVKDESKRLTLGAFKGLGASYALFQVTKEIMADHGIDQFSLADTVNSNLRELITKITFCTATDGNHGRAVAWMAQKLGAGAIIFMPRHSARQRVEAITNLNAEVRIVNGDYDQAVTEAARDASANGWIIVSDTSTVGKPETAVAISGGYLTLFHEIDEQIEQLGESSPDFIIVQAGVGALAAAAGWYYCRRQAEKTPTLVLVEPTEAACLLESAASSEPALQTTSGNLKTIMAGLNCGTPSPIAFEIIRSSVHLFVAIGDEWAKHAMRKFYCPSGDDTQIESGESGAAGLAAMLAMEKSPLLKGLRERIGMTKDSSVLLINTEGITDRTNFDLIVTKRRA